MRCVMMECDIPRIIPVISYIFFRAASAALLRPMG
eukprot:TCALIF_06438-PA protein Name:"Protein of unknown function" AED:0.14 eAED:0.14 QI:23/1/0.5/1/1/0.5/2/455/34